MNLQALQDYCLSFSHTEECFPFDQDTLVFKVGGKMFALTSLSNWEEGKPTVNLKCEPSRAIELREEYHGITPGFHMNKSHWNTVALNEDVNDQLLRSLILESYTLVFNSLSKKIRNSLL